MLYTSYISKLSSLPEDAIKLLVCKYLPKGFDIKKYSNTVHVPNLAPSDRIRNKFKYDKDFKSFITEFAKELDSKLEDLYKVKKIAESRDVYLICYESESFKEDNCHRYSIRRRVESLY